MANNTSKKDNFTDVVQIVNTNKPITPAPQTPKPQPTVNVNGQVVQLSQNTSKNNK